MARNCLLGSELNIYRSRLLAHFQLGDVIYSCCSFKPPMSRDRGKETEGGPFKGCSKIVNDKCQDRLQELPILMSNSGQRFGWKRCKKASQAPLSKNRSMVSHNCSLILRLVMNSLKSHRHPLLSHPNACATPKRPDQLHTPPYPDHLRFLPPNSSYIPYGNLWLLLRIPSKKLWGPCKKSRHHTYRPPTCRLQILICAQKVPPTGPKIGV